MLDQVEPHSSPTHDALRCSICSSYLWQRWAAVARKRYRFGAETALRLAFVRWLRRTGRVSD
jgi:hypothetical protein